MKRSPVEYQYTSAQPAAEDQINWRGYIDGWDPVEGIHGWALAADLPSKPLKLEFLVGEIALESVQTDQPRDDIAKVLGVPVVAGFCFKPAIFQRLARLNPRRRDLAVNIRVAGTNVLLTGRERLPTVGRLVDLWRGERAGRRLHCDAVVNKGERLRARLALMRAQAEAFRNLPLRPAAENELGQIDALYLDARKLVWFIGWMRRDFDTEFPALIADRQKYPGGAATLQYERQDLASRFVGVIGVIDTDWSPPAAINEFFVYVGENAHRQLHASTRTKTLKSEAFLDAYREAEAASIVGGSGAIGALLTSGDSWIPGSAAAVGIAAEASVEQLLMLPGFGCIAEGWSLSPAKDVQTFQMKLDDCLLVADDDATYFRARPDLASVFGGRQRLSRAGFVTVLRGELPNAVTGAPLLRVIFDDGTSVVKRLEPKVLRKLDFLADSAEILRLYPALRHERFYPALLDATQKQLAGHARLPTAVLAASSRRLVVLTLPSDGHNERLCFDFIARLREHSHAQVGICLIARRTLNVAEAKLLFEEFRADKSTALSLYCVDDEFSGFSALPFLLSQLSVDRFVYVEGGVLLTETGWEHAIRTLYLHGHSIRFFEIVDDTGAPDRVNGPVSAACFQWTTAAFLDWVSSAPHFIRGVFRSNGLPKPVNGNDVLPGAAMRVERLHDSRLADLIDEDFLSTGQNVQIHA